VHGGLIEPLLGIYAKSCLTSWEAMIRKGFIKLQEMVARLDLLKLEVDGNPLFSDPFFFNINTPEDFEKALTHL
jgi:molybdopterin-guanine dinucleotide biosynthesis protein A